MYREGEGRMFTKIKGKSYLLFMLVAMFFLLLSGCNTEETSSEKEADKGKEEQGADKEKEDPTKVAATIEDILKEEPGKYPGTQYNQAIIHKELNEQSFADKDSFQVYHALLELMREGENYKEHYQFFEEFNPSIETILTEMPGGITVSENGELGVNTNIAILLDASGSMAQKVGGQTKMELANKAIDDFVASMPESANVMLRVYGHKGSNDDSDKKVSCENTEVVYDFAPYEKAKFQDSLNKFKPTGWTPIARAIAETKADFEKIGTEGQNIIYVVSDGIETCDGDPVKEAKSLHDSDIQAVVNIIGFDVDNDGAKQLKEVAEAGGGEFETVNSADDFNRLWEDERRRLWNEWWNWGNKNWSNVWNEQNKKSTELINQKNSFWNKANDEKTRMREASSYLQNKEQINYETYGEVNSLIDQRYEIIREYYETKYEELNTTLKTEGEKLKESIKEREEEMKKKYAN